MDTSQKALKCRKTSQGYGIVAAKIFFHPDYTVGFGIAPNHAWTIPWGIVSARGL